MRGLGSGPTEWYNLKVTYKDVNGNPKEGFMPPNRSGII